LEFAPLPAIAWDQFLPLLLPVPLILAANWREQAPHGGGVGGTLVRAAGAAAWPALMAVSAICVLGGLLLATSQPTRVFGAVLAVAGGVSAALLLQPVRASLARLLPIDPDSSLDATALVLTVILVGLQLANQLGADVLTEQATSGPQLEPIDLIAQEVPFLVLAFLGVGFLTRRRLKPALDRLGLVRPAPWQIALALAGAGVFFAFSTGVEALSQFLTPDLAHKVDTANQRLFGRLGDPVGIATIALAAGICEEVLFRGALQPRLGLVWTSIVFAAVHSQYGLSLDVVAVFVLALCLGLMRRFFNTTTALTCHVAYDALVGLGVPQAWLIPALGAEIALVALTLGAFFTTRVGAPRVAP
jgi:uncharacterized protein